MSTTKVKKVTKRQQAKAMEVIAEWLGPWLGHEGPAPTGHEAAYKGLGPVLVPDWEGWSGGPRCTVLLEGADDWAVEITGSEGFREKMAALGLFAEPYSGYALCLYRED